MKLGVPENPPKFSAFHWPDRIIRKRESRRIREEHNALFNSHAELLEIVREAVDHWAEFDNDDEVSGADLVEWFAQWREKAKAKIRKATVNL